MQWIQDLVLKYLHHVAYLRMMKEKRGREKREKNLAYEDLVWEKLLCYDLLKTPKGFYLQPLHLTPQSDKGEEIKKNRLGVSSH